MANNKFLKITNNANKEGIDEKILTLIEKSVIHHTENFIRGKPFKEFIEGFLYKWQNQAKQELTNEIKSSLGYLLSEHNDITKVLRSSDGQKAFGYSDNQLFSGLVSALLSSAGK